MIIRYAYSIQVNILCCLGRYKVHIRTADPWIRTTGKHKYQGVSDVIINPPGVQHKILTLNVHGGRIFSQVYLEF
jgi:hypothetical protein